MPATWPDASTPPHAHPLAPESSCPRPTHCTLGSVRSRLGAVGSATGQGAANIQRAEEERLRPVVLVAGGVHGGDGLDEPRVAQRAQEAEAQVCLDMENYPYLPGTLGLYRDLHARGFGRFGIEVGAEHFLQALAVAAELKALQQRPRALGLLLQLIDALSPLGVRHADMPFTPAQVWMTMQGTPLRTDLFVDVVTLRRGVTVEEAIALYEQIPGVEYAEPNYQLHLIASPKLTAVPNDPSFGSLWGLSKIAAPATTA